MSRKLRTMNYKQAHQFVDRSKSRFYWDGWTLCKFTPKAAGAMSKDGVYRFGRWGFESRVEVGHDGTWSVYV